MHGILVQTHGCSAFAELRFNSLYPSGEFVRVSFASMHLACDTSYSSHFSNYSLQSSRQDCEATGAISTAKIHKHPLDGALDALEDMLSNAQHLHQGDLSHPVIVPSVPIIF